jgi:hypothetical protein
LPPLDRPSGHAKAKKDRGIIKKSLSLMLAGILFNLVAVSPAYASLNAEKEARHLARMKASLQKLGTGEAARVEVRLRDKTKLIGFIRASTDDSFVVVEAKTGAAITVSYPQVARVKGHNLSTGAWVAVGVRAALPTLLIIWLIAASSD